VTSTAATSTRAGVLRPEQLAAHARLARLPASDALAPWVEYHWVLRWDLEPGTSYVSSTLPHPACNLSVEHSTGRVAARVDPVVVTGVPTRRFDVTLEGTGWVHGVKFRPGGLASLAAVNARTIRDKTVPAVDVLGVAAADELRRLRPALPDGECQDIVEGVLAGFGRTPDPDYRLVLDVVGLMLADRSLVRVSQVEKHFCLGRRTLQRLFERYVGVSPKWVLSRYRMHDVVTTLDAGYDGSLADLAARFGWFDQAHFAGEFTDLVGVPPSDYRAGVVILSP